MESTDWLTVLNGLYLDLSPSATGEVFCAASFLEVVSLGGEAHFLDHSTIQQADLLSSKGGILWLWGVALRHPERP